MPFTGEALAFSLPELDVENAPVRLRMMRSTTTAIPATTGRGTVDHDINMRSNNHGSSCKEVEGEKSLFDVSLCGELIRQKKKKNT